VDQTCGSVVDMNKPRTQTNPRLQVMSRAAGKAARARRAVEQFRDENSDIIDGWEHLKAEQEAAELALKELAADSNVGGTWPKFGLDVLVTPHTMRTVDAVQLINEIPDVVGFTSAKHGPLLVVRLAAYDAAVDAGVVPNDVDQLVVIREAGTPRVTVMWTKVG
jgi:hypothetical protein